MGHNILHGLVFMGVHTECEGLISQSASKQGDIISRESKHYLDEVGKKG